MSSSTDARPLTPDPSPAPGRGERELCSGHGAAGPLHSFACASLYPVAGLTRRSLGRGGLAAAGPRRLGPTFGSRSITTFRSTRRNTTRSRRRPRPRALAPAVHANESAAVLPPAGDFPQVARKESHPVFEFAWPTLPNGTRVMTDLSQWNHVLRCVLKRSERRATPIASNLPAWTGEVPG